MINVANTLDNFQNSKKRFGLTPTTKHRSPKEFVQPSLRHKNQKNLLSQKGKPIVLPKLNA